ncbi:MAG: hypothetical protein KGI25_01100 [Thaumarchaeota archaeon]|nr:hypothetical protein [Nitrososphaerota archaeon]
MTDIPIQIANMTSPIIVRADDLWSPTTIATMLLAIATIGLTILAIKQARSAKIQAESLKTQTDILKQEFESSHRAWVAVSDKEMIFNPTNPLQLIFHYRNYGKTVATNLRERWNIITTKPTRDSLLIDNANLTMPSVNLPTQERKITISVPPNFLASIVSEQGEVYVWVIIDYFSLKENKGQYGVIAKFRRDRSSEVIDEWII